MKTGIKNTIVLLGFLAGSLASTHAAYFNSTPIASCDTRITSYLSYGSENYQVETLQNILARAGYLQANPNGYFGPSTRAAVRAFQADNGLATSGVVGQATLNALNERACDTDVRGDSLSYAYQYGVTPYYQTAAQVTYVDPYDAYVKVVSPVPQTPAVYTVANTSIAAPYTTTNPVTVVTPSPSSSVVNTTLANIPPAQSAGIASTQLSYSPSIGYYYSVTPASGSLTIGSPRANATYNENDTVYVSWATSNLTASAYQVYLENTTTGGSKLITTTSGTSASFVLSKDILDVVCSGSCDQYKQSSFRVVVATPITDIAGTTSLFKAVVSPISIKRPFWPGTVSITASKTPVNSAELFKLYVNIPTGASWDANIYGNYSFKVRAICPPSVTVSIAGTQCGQDFVIPFAPAFFQSEIPTTITNVSWYPQTVTYQITVTNLAGQVIGSAETSVKVNQAPFSW